MLFSQSKMLLGEHNLLPTMAHNNKNAHKFVTPSDLSVPQTPASPFDANLETQSPLTLTHTPQNSCVTVDSIAATCDSVISPRNRRKGVKINTNINGSSNRLNISSNNSIGSNNTLSQITSSGMESPPSPLSEMEARTINDITDNFQYQSTKSRTNTNPNTNTNTDTNSHSHSHKSQLMSYLYNNNDGHTQHNNHNGHNHKKSDLIDKYKEKLTKLNNLLSPMQLFHDIDLMIRNYHKLKKEYCLQWELQQLYRQQIRSLLKQS